MTVRIDQWFNRLRIYAPAGKKKWLCVCQCGRRKEIRESDLGRAKSCGCERHSLSDTPEYLAWRDMHRRCYDPNNKKYKDYGGRNIGVCERWHDFDAFLEDVGKRPPEADCIDRINNNGSYEPGNVRWTTYAQSNRNLRSNHRIEYRGVTLTLVEWSDIMGISSSAIRKRLLRGWPVERALTEGRKIG